MRETRTPPGPRINLARTEQTAARRRRLLFVLVALVSLLAPACGGTENASTRQGASVAQRQSDGTLANAHAGHAAPGVAAQDKYDSDDGAAPDAGREGAESYGRIDENPFLEVAAAPLSTFSIDVDTASYSNTRRFIEEGRLPPPDAVRIEELINYFSYDYPQPSGGAPFSVTAEAAECPWAPAHRLVHIGLQGRRVAPQDVPPANLVFLVDVSGSMRAENKLPLVKSSLRVLTEQLTARDRVALVVYAGTSGLVLPPTPGDRQAEILSALERLQDGGSTNGGEGIRLAYRVAEEGFIRGGTNRVLLATDGDFNVGVTSQTELVRLVEEKRRGGVQLSVLGYGMGNLKDSTLEQLADRGDGNYAYIDTPAEARKVLGAELGGTLHTIARDVKIQVEFNPRLVAGYRLIGYENRLLRDRDFNDDRVDAGEIGSGHTVTALYEIVPAGRSVPGGGGVDGLKYQHSRPGAEAAGGELLTVKLRYKEPEGAESRLVSVGVRGAGGRAADASENFRFASAVAAFGMLLRGSQHSGAATYDDVLRLALSSVGDDPQGHRAQFVQLAGRARELSARAAD